MGVVVVVVVGVVMVTGVGVAVEWLFGRQKGSKYKEEVAVNHPRPQPSLSQDLNKRQVVKRLVGRRRAGLRYARRGYNRVCRAAYATATLYLHNGRHTKGERAKRDIEPHKSVPH